MNRAGIFRAIASVRRRVGNGPRPRTTGLFGLYDKRNRSDDSRSYTPSSPLRSLDDPAFTEDESEKKCSKEDLDSGLMDDDDDPEDLKALFGRSSDPDIALEGDNKPQTISLRSTRQDVGNITPFRESMKPLSSPEMIQSPVNVPQSEPSLSPEQAELVEIIMSGRNVFYTGSAGCGKSTVLKAFTSRLRAQGKTVHIVAPTGRAALGVSGLTTWSYAGWTPNSHKKSLEHLGGVAWRERLTKDCRGECLTKDGQREAVHERLQQTDVLVIDEISMVENFHFRRLSEMMKKIRSCSKAFGGVQLIVTGDFHQLPPVKPFQHCMDCGREMIKNDSEETYTCEEHGLFYDKDKWTFQSQTWEECDFAYFSLKTIHRQTDEIFIKILQKIRVGDSLARNEAGLLMNHQCTTENATRLYPTRKEVRRVNQREFERLGTKKISYKCVDYFEWNEELHPHLQSKGVRLHDDSLLGLKEDRFERVVEIKVGMLVVLLVNLDLKCGLCNGSQGVVCGYERLDPVKLPQVRPYDKNEPGRLNVIRGECARLKESEIKTFIDRAENKVWPIVKFNNGEVRTVYADCSVRFLGDKMPYSVICRTQIPLLPAWAMTIHKSQSLTLSRVIVDLSRAWEEGQVYVALSRATSLGGLKVEGDPQGLVIGKGGNPEVKKFYETKFGV